MTALLASIIWKQFGNNVETIGKQFGNKVETVWKQVGNNALTILVPPAPRKQFGNMFFDNFNSADTPETIWKQFWCFVHSGAVWPHLQSS